MRIPNKGDIVFSDEDGWYGLLIKDAEIVHSDFVCTVLVLRRDLLQKQAGTIAEWKLRKCQILRKGCTEAESC
jgi:hypothetical protein